MSAIHERDAAQTWPPPTVSEGERTSGHELEHLSFEHSRFDGNNACDLWQVLTVATIPNGVNTNRDPASVQEVQRCHANSNVKCRFCFINANPCVVASQQSSPPHRALPCPRNRASNCPDSRYREGLLASRARAVHDAVALARLEGVELRAEWLSLLEHGSAARSLWTSFSSTRLPDLPDDDTRLTERPSRGLVGRAGGRREQRSERRADVPVSGSRRWAMGGACRRVDGYRQL